MNAMNAMTKQKTETEKPGDAAHYEELEELQLESVAPGGKLSEKEKMVTPAQYVSSPFFHTNLN